jgi:hypothetical protein
LHSKTAGFPTVFEKKGEKERRKHMKNEGFLGICPSPQAGKKREKKEKEVARGTSSLC